MSPPRVAVRRLPHGAGLALPARATPHSAGFDLVAAVDRPIDLEPGSRVLVPSGIAVALPPGYEAQVRPRSGLALDHGVTVLNSPGTIDSDYRGEIGIILVNLGRETFRVEPGMRIAQMVIGALCPVTWTEVERLPASRRGADGFGSTGTGGGE